MQAGSIAFGTTISSNFTKFQAQPGHTYRAAVLHYVDESSQLQSIMRYATSHFHQTPEGVQGLGSFFCLSTEESVGPCCKNAALFGDPVIKIAIPIILYPTSFQGDIIPGGQPDIQIMLVYEAGWNKLSQIHKGYPLSANDFQITGKKAGRGVKLDFLPAGPAYWQTDEKMFASLLAKAKAIVEGPGLANIDKLLGRKVLQNDVENALRQAAGLPPAMPAGMMAPIPPMPGMGMGMGMAVPPPPMAAPPMLPVGALAAVPPPQMAAPMAVPPPAQMAPPIQQSMAVPPPAQMAPPQSVAMPAPAGPASPSQLAALGAFMAPPPPANPDAQ